MAKIVVLDSGPIGMITNPNPSSFNARAARWYMDLKSQGIAFVVPEIIDYEIRRELLLGNKKKGLIRLEILENDNVYYALTTEAMRRAARFWALSRMQGQPTAEETVLDADVILAGQVAVLVENGYDVIVATTNVRHLSQFIDARLWEDIQPDTLL